MSRSNTPEVDRSLVARRTWRAFGFTAAMLSVIPILVFGGLVGWFFGGQIIVRKRVALQVEALRQKGELTDLEGLQQYYRQRTSEAHSETWSELVHDLNGSREGQQLIQNLYDGIDSQQAWPDQSKVDEFDSEYSDFIDRLMLFAILELESDTKPVYRAIDFSVESESVGNSQLIPLMGRLLVIRHALALKRRDSEEQFRCIRAAQGLQRSLRSEYLYAFCIRNTVDTMARRMLQRSLAANRFTDQQLKQIDDGMPEFKDLQSNLRDAMRAERVFAIAVCLGPDSDRYPVGVAMLKKDPLGYLQWMEQVVQIDGSDLQDHRDLSSQLSREYALQIDAERVLATMGPENLRSSYGGFFIGSDLLLNWCEHVRLAKIAIAVQRFRSQENVWPSTLDDLSAVGVVAKNLAPLDHPAFGYRIQDNEAIIWGFDRNDGQVKLPEEPPVGEAITNAQTVWRLSGSE